MFEQDYIVRAIRQFVQALVRIVANKREERWDDALAEIATSMGSLTGMTPEQVCHLPLDSLLAMLRGPQGPDGERAAAVARLLKEHGEVYELAGRAGSKPYYVRAFCLLDELSESDALPPAETDTLSWLVDRLD